MNVNGQLEIDQVVWRYVEGSADGLQIVSTSLSQGGADLWHARLKSRIRLEKDSSGWLPKRALSYHAYGEEAAVVLRLNTGHSEARNDSRGLIGPRDVLTPQVAAGLMWWSEWNQPYESFRPPRVNGSDIARVAAQQEGQLRELALREEDLLIELLATMIDNPSTPLSVVNFGSSEDTAVALVWGVIQAGSASDVRRPWTFSTWETRHDLQVMGLPELVFLPERQSNPPASIDRIQLDTSQNRTRPPSADYASSLVRNTLLGVPVGLLPTPTTAGHSVGGVNDLTVQIGVSGTSAPSATRSPAPPPVLATGDTMTAVGDRWPAPETSGTYPSGGPNPPQPDVHPVVERLVKDLLAADDTDKLLGALQAVERQLGNDQKLRWQLRERMRALSAWDQLGVLIDNTVREDLVARVVAVTFGPHKRDLGSSRGRGQAIDIIKTGQWPLLSRQLAAGEQAPDFTQALADRFMSQPSPPDEVLPGRFPTLAPPAAELGPAAPAASVPPSDTRFWAQPAVMTSLALIGVFLLGLVVSYVVVGNVNQRLTAIEQRLPAQPSAAGPTSTTEPPIPTTTVAPPPTENPRPTVPATITEPGLNYDANWLAYVLVQTDDGNWTGYPCIAPRGKPTHDVKCTLHGGPYSAARLVAVSPDQAAGIDASPGKVDPNKYLGLKRYPA